MTPALAPRDAERLADLEVTIAQGLSTFVEVGGALAEIRETRLYRAEFVTFEEYCQRRWYMNASRARQLIASAQVVAAVESVTTVTPANEAQTRPLASLEPEQQREVWKEAVETAPEGKVSAKHVAQTVERVTRPLFIDKPASPPPIPINRANVVTDTIAAAKAEYRNSEEGRLLAYIGSLPPVPAAVSDATIGGLHISGLEILRIQAAFINRAIAQREKVNVPA